jgi:hypothetical protein
MNYTRFLALTKDNLIEKLFVKLGFLESEIKFISIDNNPNYDISPYEREQLANYYFKNKWDFRFSFDFIIEAKVLGSAIFHNDHITEICDEYKIDYEPDYDKYTDIVEKAYAIDKDSFSNHSFDADLENYKLNDLQISSINNEKKELIYEGSYWGDSSSIDPLDFELIARIKVFGADKYFNNQEFYSQLLIESFILISENKNKLSFFMTYSALENFVNTIMNSHEEDSRFKDKVKELFKTHLTNYSTNQIYTSVIGDFDKFTTIRNTIVHGKEEIEIDDDCASSFLRFVLILVALYTWKDSTFEELKNRLE